MSEFLNKIIVVTGGYRGNGLAIVNSFLKGGAKVYSLDNKFLKKKETIGKLTRIKVDISNLKLIKKIIYQIGKNENKINVLVNNAGISLQYSEKNVINYWIKTISVNLTAAYFLSFFSLTFLKRNKGSSIINITSLSGKIAMSSNPAYNASKGGLSALTASLAMDYAKYGIRVNGVCPGYIKTNMTNKSFNNRSSYKKRVERMMIKKYGSPNDIAEAVIFLASQKSKHINATEIIVDGGLLKKGI